MARVAAGEKAAPVKGIAYLAGAQAANGGWVETDAFEYTEVDSEALHAICDCVEGF